jgi:hypothetical protein
MRTLVVVRPTTMTLLRLPTLHMIMMIEGPPLFGAWCQRGSVLTIYPCGGGVYLRVYLSIYLRIVDMYELICVVWRVMKNLEPFKFVRPTVLVWNLVYLLVMLVACYLSLCWFVYHVICITVSISHLCTCVCKLRVKSLLSVW